MLGVCLGMQLTCIEFARHVLGLEGANSSELDPETKYPIIDIMRDQIDDGRHGRNAPSRSLPI